MSMTMAQALGIEVQREVEFPKHSSSSEWAPREGLEVCASRIDATMATGCREDPKTYEETSTNTDHRWVGGWRVELQSL